MDNLKNIIEGIINSSLENHSSIGENCAVFKDGKELFSGSFGLADRENNIPMSKNSIFRLFSLSKPVTSAAVMILFDRGMLSPDTPVSDIFPEFSELTYIDENDDIHPCNDTLTIQHLLTMTSGLPYANNFNKSVCGAGRLFDSVIEGIDKTGCGVVTTEEFCRRAARIPLSFRPGERWDYGISADILGGIAERVSGMKYGEFLRENIFAPLGMDDTGFYVPEDKLDRLTALYSWGENGLRRDFGNYLGLTDYTAPPAFESGGAGLVSTIGDYARFACMLANRGELDGVRIISESSFEYMTAPRLDTAQAACLWDRLKGYNYGSLMRVMTDADKSQIKTCNGEFGWDGWSGTYFCADPVNRIAVLYFTQICGAGTTREAAEISSAVYGALAGK